LPSAVDVILKLSCNIRLKIQNLFTQMKTLQLYVENYNYLYESKRNNELGM